MENIEKFIENNNPTLTIIIPYKEDRGKLHEALSSVGELDKTELIEVILSKSDANQAVNFNNGLKAAKGDYVHILHDDDKVKSDFSNVIRYLHFLKLSNRKIHLMISDAENYTSGSSEIFKSSFSSYDKLLDQNTIHGGTCFYYRRDLIEIEGMRETLRTGEEYDLNLRLIKQYGAPFYLPILTKFYRIWEGNKGLNHKGFETREERKRYIKNEIINKNK